MNVLRRLEKIVASLRGALEADDLHEEVQETIRESAETLEKAVARQRAEIAANAKAQAAVAAAERKAAIAEVEALAKSKGLSVKVLSRPATKKPSADPAVVRAWAVDNGLEVKDRGVIPKSIYAAYAEAYSK